jgi:hypothetical protein
MHLAVQEWWTEYFGNKHLGPNALQVSLETIVLFADAHGRAKNDV